MTGACDACLRRGYLVGRLAARIAAMLDRPGKRVGALLSLPEAGAGRGRAGGRGRCRGTCWAASTPRGRERRWRSARCAPSAGTTTATRRSCSSSTTRPPCCSSRARATWACSRTTRRWRWWARAGRRPTGARWPTSWGAGSAAAGVPVVSGLALGHRRRGAPRLPGRRRCSRSRCWPAGRTCPTRAPTAASTSGCASDGLVVSELPPGQRPYRWSFPARNRIMAGLARITVVVEAADPSGLADHHAVRHPARARRGRGARTGHLAGGRGHQQPAQGRSGRGHGPAGPARRAVRQRVRRGARGSAAALPAGAIEDPVQLRLLEAVEAGLGIDGICAHAGVPGAGGAGGAVAPRALGPRAARSAGRLPQDGAPC